ncbi:hypothetical protein PITC_062600 [Penicillium italicum]|uniref:Uncharacterized protein n=1 Tax=Penicillium italicum TaxID=40296 RepID=A0A0A2L3U4_PENIT|nr:hypothetical protein PITC_062600 [Penicillium italicum]
MCLDRTECENIEKIPGQWPRITKFDFRANQTYEGCSISLPLPPRDGFIAFMAVHALIGLCLSDGES